MMFHGFSEPFCGRSEPTSSAAVVPPFGLRQLAKPTASSSTLGDAGGREHGVLLAADEQGGIVEALGAERHDPQVGLATWSSMAAMRFSEPR